MPEAAQGVQAWDRYAYVNNSPINFNDPSGHMLACQSESGNGCEGFGPGRIIEAYGYDDWGMDHALRNYIRTHENYSPYGDPTLDDSDRFFVATAQFQVYAEDAQGDKNKVLQGMAYGASMGAMGIVLGGGSNEPQGGVYSIRNPDGQVVRVGRTNNFDRREGEYWRDPNYFDLKFKPEYYTNDYATQRGLEQMMYDKYHPPLNVNRPVAINNSNLNRYIEAAFKFLSNFLGGN